MAGFRAMTAGGQPVDENYSGNGVISNVLRTVGAKFKSWGRAAQPELAPAEPILDLSQPVNAFNAWDDRMRNGTPAPAPSMRRSTPDVTLAAVTSAAPASTSLSKPATSMRSKAGSGRVISQPDEEGMRDWTQKPDGSWGPQDNSAVNTAMVPGVDNSWLTADKNGGYAEVAGDPSMRLYAAKADPSVAAAPAQAATSERDTTYDPGTQGAWAREQGAQNLLNATGGWRGLTALSGYETAQMAPGLAQVKAQGDATKQLLENKGKLAEAHVKGGYGLKEHGIDKEATIGAAALAAESRVKAAIIAGKTDLEIAKLNGISAKEVAVIRGKFGVAEKQTEVDVVPAATKFKTMADSITARRKALNDEAVLLGKNKDKIAKHAAAVAVLDEDEAALYDKEKKK